MTSLVLYLKANSDAISQLNCNLIILIPYVFLCDVFLAYYFLDMGMLQFGRILGPLMSISTGINFNC